MKIAKICSTRVFTAVLTAGMLAVPAYVATPRALAQTAATGTISGTITDASGAAVPNTTVVITNTDTGASRTVTTNNDGDYSTTFLQPGHYEVVAGGTGNFGKVTRKNLVLTVGQTLSVDEKLPAASVAQDVTVSDVSPLIDSEKTEISQTVDQQLVSNLPVNGRRWDNFVLLTTNVVPDGNSGLISYRGISGLYNTNLVDGANNQQAFFSEARGRAIGSPYVFSQDSIKEFASSASGYSAEFGQAAGGQVNAITKNGTNLIHGDLFYYLRYPTLNALDPFAKFTGRTSNQPFLLTPTVRQQQQFGGSVGGPIIKDKLFYFFTYDGFRKVNPLLYTSSISASSLAGYQCPAGVSPTQCDAAKAYILSGQTAVSRNVTQDIFFPRLDYQLNSKNHISVNFNWQNYKQPNGYTTSATANNSSATTNGRADFHERFLVANWESVVSSKSANTVRFQWSRDLETTGANAPGPSVTISGLFAYGMPNALPRGAFPDEHRWQFADIFSTVHGKHSLKFGADINLIHEQLSNLFQGGGIYSYSQATPLLSFQSWVQDVYGANGGRHYNTFTQVNDPITHVGADDFWNKNIAGFAEDAWKLRNDFTLTVGVRYDVQLIPAPPRPYTNSYNGVPSPLGNYYTNTIKNNMKMVQPRIGFAWSPVDGMVVRGGYGMFYGLTSGSTLYCTRVENGVFQQQYTVGPGAAGAPQNMGVLFTPPGPALAAPFAGAVTPTVQNTGAGAIPLSFRGQDPNFTNPYTHSVDLAVEQRLPGNVSFTISYIGTRGMRLPYFIDANLPRTASSKTWDIISSTGVTQSTIKVPFYSGTRPSPNDGIILVGFSGINSWYHSGAFSIRKPFSHGVELLANYTWAKAIDGSQVSGQNGTFNGTNAISDPFNLKNPGTLNEYGRSDLDMRGRFVGSIVYAPTFGLSNSILRYAANGWTVSGTATEQTGLPLTQFVSNFLSAANGGGIDGGVTGGVVSLFASSTGGRAPQYSRNNIPGPGIRNVDARVSRSFPIHENVKFEVFAEVFNLANRRHIIAQSTNAFSVLPTFNTASAPSQAGACLGHSNSCIAPFTATPFGAPTATSSVLFGPRQVQVAAKLWF
ncbi:MAG: TonB-dependent receptor [Acidobacteria bacterium]|nr:TonB-dependent receptor [Acidobacteriota bacterium]